MIRLVTRGRFTHEYAKRLLAAPEDREPAVRKLVEGAGGKVISFYFTTGETDFLLTSEANEAEAIIAARGVINTISTIVIAAFAVVLARVAWKQTRDARILQRAYLNVKFGGIQSDSAGELVGHVTFQNVGHLPARKLYWLVKLNRGGSDWRPPKIKSKELVGENVIPIGAEWPQGSKGRLDPQDWDVPHQDEIGLYLYVWG